MELKINNAINTQSFNIYVKFDLLFESKFVYYSIIRYLNENIKIREDLSLSWLQNLDFSNLEEFVSHFENFDKEILKILIREKIEDAELIKTIKPKLFSLHKLADLFIFLNNFSAYLVKQQAEEGKKEFNLVTRNIFNLKVLYNPDFLVDQFIEGSGKDILKEIKQIIKDNLTRYFVGNKEEIIFEMKAEFLEIKHENIKKSFIKSDGNYEKRIDIVIDYQIESLLESLLLSNSNLDKIVNILFFFKALPKSEKTLNLELLRNLLTKAVADNNNNNKDRLISFSENLIKLSTTDENDFLKYVMTSLINLNPIHNSLSLNKSLFFENNFCLTAEINLQSLVECTKKIYFQNKPTEEILTEANLTNKNTITIHKLFEASKPNFFSESFLNLNNISEFIFKYNNSYLTYKFSYLNTWNVNKSLKSPITIQGIVTHGLKRGSKLLGIPTANLTPFETSLIKNLINGVYYGDFIFKENKDNNPNIALDKTYKGVLSIGYNPQFDNREKSIEVFLIDFEGEDFYDYKVCLNIRGYIRTEAAFENFQELVTSISYDIIVANGLF